MFLHFLLTLAVIHAPLTKVEQTASLYKGRAPPALSQDKILQGLKCLDKGNWLNYQMVISVKVRIV